MKLKTSFKGFNNIAGGWAYHYTAWRYKKLWRPYLNEVKEWLTTWKPRSEELLLIGPSAGYSLNLNFLKRFAKVTAIEVDPLAKMIFQIKHPKIKIIWDETDYFNLLEGPFQPDGFKRITEKYPHSAILFCNFIGQVPHLALKHHSPEEFQNLYLEWTNTLNLCLQDREWASYHDTFSGKGTQPIQKQTTETVDHLTTGILTPSKDRRLIKWQRLPSTWHLIEAIY